MQAQDQVDHVDRGRLAETCGTRDESPSSNLGRGKQVEAIRVDDMDPTGSKGIDGGLSGGTTDTGSPKADGTLC